MARANSPKPETDDWNVLTSPWLEVVDLDGRVASLSPLQALQDSASLHRIALANPLDIFAAHRFLLTLLYWTADAAGGVEKTRKALIVGKPPKAIITELKKAEDSFYLFDAKRPFLQDVKVASGKPSSAGYLFAEMATGTNVALFDHTRDANAQLCLRCATIGLLRLTPWSQSGGRSLPTAIHGSPPVMAVALGSHLSETLGRNLVPLDAPQGKPTWSGKFQPTGTANISVMEAFTWNPRRVHLLAPSPSGICSRCGQRSMRTIGPIAYVLNDACKREKDGKGKAAPRLWRDPSAFYSRDSLEPFRSTREQSAATENDARLLLSRLKSKGDDALFCPALADHDGADVLVVTCPP